jgi:RimJ/RimL family protein N-acetyltransferase
MKEQLFLSPLIIEDLPFLSGTGYASMLEKTKLKMLSDSQAKQYTDGNYFEVFTIRDGNDVIGFASLYSKEPGFVSIGLDIREQYRRQGYGTRSAEPIA